MEVAALCIRLLVTVLLLLIVQLDFSCSQTADEAFPQVVPNRQQHFQHDPIEVSCEGLEGLTGWRVMKKVKEKEVQTCVPDWVKSTGPCKITNAFQTVDSGEYWCELGGKKSNTVNIIVTAGSVILESPVHPVKQGDTVTLYCKSKPTSSNITAEFFKNGHIMESRSTGNLTIESVSTSNEGLYTCRISGVESPGSWLTDGSVILEIPALPVMKGDSVTLNCRNKQTSSNLPADFYREGLLIGNSSTGEMIIHNVSKSDEGLYKCRMSGAGESPGSWLAVRDGSVILKIPVLPVMEGDSVTLKCRNKQTSSNLPADFYKDGLLIGTNSTGEMIIHNVSKSDEGLYKCRMSGAGESPGSWLAVRDLHRVTCSSLDHSYCLLVRTVLTILIVAVLLPVVVLLHCGKLRVTIT